MRYTLNNLRIAPNQAHELHTGDYTWRQSNCYVDLWIEVLHSLALNPLASFAFTLATDFEGDQWTFFKIPAYDLLLLYGINIQELNIWDNMVNHLVTQTERNRLTLVEVDAFYLPDVSDTSYHQAHEKTTIGIHTMDTQERVLGYFHNSGNYTLQGDDFTGIFAPSELPLYVEFAKFDRLQNRTEPELAEIAAQLLRFHLAHAPSTNPFSAYTAHFGDAFSRLHNLEYFHKYAFATMRQYGACYQYAALFLQWLAPYEGAPLAKAAEHLQVIADTAQILLLKTARAVKTQKPFAFMPLLMDMQNQWQQAMEQLQTHL